MRDGNRYQAEAVKLYDNGIVQKPEEQILKEALRLL